MASIVAADNTPSMEAQFGEQAMTDPDSNAPDIAARDDELQPCPFCGGPAELTGHQAPEFWVRCDIVGCKATTEGFGSKERAIAAWNRRAALKAREA